MNHFLFSLITAVLVLAGSSCFAETFTMKNLTIEIDDKNIIEAHADAMIVPHFRDKISINGAGLSISRKGGNDALEAANQTLRDTHPSYGQAFVTSTLNLRGKILNVVTLGADPTREAMIVETAVMNALAIAGGNGMEFVAVPPLGVGEGTLTARESAHAIISGARTYAAILGKVHRLRIMIPNAPEVYETFVKVLSEKNIASGCGPDLE